MKDPPCKAGFLLYTHLQPPFLFPKNQPDFRCKQHIINNRHYRIIIIYIYSNPLHFLLTTSWLPLFSPNRSFIHIP